MITISENATLEKNSISIEMILCHDCDQQKCQDIISMKTFVVIWRVNMISVNVTVLQRKNTMLVIIELIFLHTSYCNRNLVLWVNNKSLYPNFYNNFRSKQWVTNLRWADLEKYLAEQLYKNYTMCAKHWKEATYCWSNSYIIWHCKLTSTNHTKAIKSKAKICPADGRYWNFARYYSWTRTTTTHPTKDWNEMKNLMFASSAVPTKKENQKCIEKFLRTQKALSCLKGYLPSDSFAFIESQVVKAQKKSKHSNQWNTKGEVLALSIYFHSKKAYCILSRLLVLPSMRALQCHLQKMSIEPGFVENVFVALGQKVCVFGDTDRFVSLVFDEMSIKDVLVYSEMKDQIDGFEDFGHLGRTKYIANHATVFMVWGLASKWKQPIGYFLSAGPIKASILQVLTRICINELETIGLHVVALICNQGTNNRSFLHSLKEVTVEKPFKKCNNKKVFVFYDPPHLLKNVRNNLKKGDLQFDDEKVCWKCIVDFFKFDKSQPIWMASKLKEKHIELPPFQAMHVNLVAQVLSHSVAARISTLVTLKYLPEQAVKTATFVDHFDALFNTFNSKTLKSTQQMGPAFQQSSSHHAFPEKSLNVLS